MTAGLQGGGSGLHIVFIDGHAGGQGHRIGRGSGEIVVEGEDQRAAAALGGRGRDDALLEGIAGVLRQVRIGAVGVHVANGPGEHGGHNGPGDLPVWAEIVVLIPLDDAVHAQQIDRRLGTLTDGGGVVKAHGVGGEPLGHGAELHGADQVDRQILLDDGRGERAGLGKALQIGFGEDPRGQADGELPVEPGLAAVQYVVHRLFIVVGDLGTGVLIQSHGPGAESQRLRGGQLVLRLKGPVLIALEHIGVGHFLDIALGPVALDIGERGGGGRGQRQRGHSHGQRQRAGEESVRFHSAHLQGVDRYKRYT